MSLWIKPKIITMANNVMDNINCSPSIRSGHSHFELRDTGTLFKMFTSVDIQGLNKLFCILFKVSGCGFWFRFMVYVPIWKGCCYDNLCGLLFWERLNITLKLENAGGSSILVDMNNYLEDLVMICPHCRQLNPSGAFYCIRCQHRLSNIRKV